MYSEADLLPLSGLQHLAFCERQCALIHVERAWDDNVFTAEGRLLHQKVDSAADENRGSLRILRSAPIRSFRLGVVGKADVVELRQADSDSASNGSVLKLIGVEGLWRPVPVEYKRGRPKHAECDRVQVCAQGMCLEEMLNVSIGGGVIFYGKTRRRVEVAFDRSLRDQTEALAGRFHELIAEGQTPMAFRESKCESCSLLDVCLPQPRERRRSAVAFLEEHLAHATVDVGETA